MARAVTVDQLVTENRAFENTAGVSANNRSLGFVPAFLDTVTGNVYLSCNPDGTLAVCHRMDGLPDALAVAHDATGRVTAIPATVIAGFARDGRFFTREQAARCAAND